MSNNTQEWTYDDDLGMDDASTEPPAPPEPGVYRATVVEADPTKSREGKPMLKFQLRLDTKRDGSELPPRQSRKLFDNAMLSKEGAFRVKQIAVAAGVEPPTRSRGDIVSEFCQSLVGQTVLVRTKIDTKPYNGRYNARVDRYFSEEQLAKAEAELAAGPNGATSNGAEVASIDQRPKRRAAR